MQECIYYYSILIICWLLLQKRSRECTPSVRPLGYDDDERKTEMGPASGKLAAAASLFLGTLEFLIIIIGVCVIS